MYLVECSSARTFTVNKIQKLKINEIVFKILDHHQPQIKYKKCRERINQCNSLDNSPEFFVSKRIVANNKILSVFFSVRCVFSSYF